MCFLERVFYQSGAAKKLGRVLLLLRQVHRLALEHVQQRLRALHDLLVGRLGLLDRFVVLVPRRDFSREVVVDARQPLRQDAQVVLDFGCARRAGASRRARGGEGREVGRGAARGVRGRRTG